MKREMNSPFRLLNGGGSVHVFSLATTISLLFFFFFFVVVLARPQDPFEMHLAEVQPESGGRRKPIISQEEQIAKWKSQIGSACSWENVRKLNFFFFLFVGGDCFLF